MAALQRDHSFKLINSIELLAVVDLSS